MIPNLSHNLGTRFGRLAALILAPSAAWAQEILLTDDFTADMNVRAGALDYNIENRQSGTLAPIDYMSFNGTNPNVQLGNITTMRSGGDGNYLLLAFGGKASLNQNFNGPLTRSGLEISFDVAANLDTSSPAALSNWTAINIGSAPDVREVTVNGARRHFGFLFRANGLTQAFDRTRLLSTDIPWSPMIEGGIDNFDPVRLVITDPTDGNPFDGVGTTKIEVFSSLIDGGESPIYSFTREAGGFADNYISFTSNSIGAIDNLAITTAPDRVELDESFLYTPLAESDPIGQLMVATEDSPEPYTFELVAGPGDTDNAKFTIAATTLRAGSHDFSLDAEGTAYRARVRATGTVSGTVLESVLVLNSVFDFNDNRMSDTWELFWAGDLGVMTEISNLDGDSLSDFEEYAISRGPFPIIDPTSPDSDGDGLEDGDEYAGTDTRQPTNPTAPDTDGDFYWDGYEFDNGSDPNNVNSLPPLPPGIDIIPLTDDASSGVDPSNVYTHTISGGGAATINGVFFEELSPALTPTNFIWDAPGNKDAIPPIRNEDWIPENGGVTGPGLLDLLGGFTYSPQGAEPGSAQTFTLTGLVPGQTYDLRLYIRKWDTQGSGRPIEIVVTNGADPIILTPPSGGIPEDRPRFLPGLPNDDAAYILSYPYTAETTELAMDTNVPFSAPANSGSFHLYGLSNQVSGSSLPDFRISHISRHPATGDVTLTWNSSPGQVFDVEVSPTLGAGSFVILDADIDAADPGTSTTYVDSILAPVTPDALYYRVRRR
ncbi:hypothetical protein BH23VER1_BH23VER1_20890 [soil metagenome]